MLIRQSFLNGMAYIAAFLGVISVLAVAAFHFPQYLTTPALRDVYDEQHVRSILFSGMLLATLLALVALFWSSKKRLAVLGLVGVLLAWMAGGADVSLGTGVRESDFYISLDWVLLDLVIIATLFINLELFFRLKKDQRILRRGWQVDLSHYVANHIFNGGLVFLMFLPSRMLEMKFSPQSVQDFFSGQQLLIQVLLIMIFTDFVQYWVHRAFHRIPILWRFHQVHHSVEKMDWLAGSRLHFGDILITRSLSLIPMVVLGFSTEAINLYLPILALQSVFIHCNLEFEFPWLQKVVTTPKYHHWHHTSDPEHVDQNFAISLPFLDLVFGTYYSPKGKWPETYGLANNKIEGGYLHHLMLPFRTSK
ncbi:MAG: sterol desaturase/sphingolipid hydroxylase (fatty acid hydroxylase superfamily) [Rhodothermales bacterium]|jgi:sterol desaturase/sphingolipid hydroxylase (fatty acid hydroxylase superfamily)